MTVVRLLQLTDLHLFEDTEAQLYGVRTAASFEAVLAHALANRPEPPHAVLVTGDIAEDGRSATYRRFHARMIRLGVPVLCIPGNHEDAALMSQLLNDPPLQYCGSRNFGNWQIVMLDSPIAGEDGGWLSTAELDRLDHALSASTGGHALVVLHHQPIPMGSPWLDGVGLANAAELLEVLDRHQHVRAVLWGHVHQASDRMRNGVRMLSTPSTCAQFTPQTQNCLMDTRPPGYRWLDLSADGGIETEVLWLDDLQPNGRPPDSRHAMGSN